MPSAELIPMLGGLWVLTNAALGGLGSSIDWPVTCAFVAGWINGSVLAGIALATASERFQAGTGGLLGGCSRSALRSVGSMVWKITEGLHNFVDNAFRAMGIEINERIIMHPVKRLSTRGSLKDLDDCPGRARFAGRGVGESDLRQGGPLAHGLRQYPADWNI